MLSVSILEMYAKGFESLVKLPRLSLKKRISVKAKSSESEIKKIERKNLPINYFAGPNNIVIPEM